MKKMSLVKRSVITAVCIALCYVLPLLFHALNIGSVFSPMHIPVLLCGLICGGGYGALCGIAGPVLSCLLSGMPAAVKLIYFIPELAVYGLIAGIMMKFIRTGKLLPDLYISLTIAMVAGRIIGGIAQALFYVGSGESFTVAAIATGYFVTTLPGIICHLILIPILVTVLMKSRLIPNRYSKGENNEKEKCD